MNARIAAVLVVLLAVMGGGALLYYQQGQSQRPAKAAALGRTLLAGLKAAEVRAIHIREPKAALTVELKDERWVIAERAAYPADLTRVREFLLAAIELKIGQTEPIAEADRVRLALDSGGTLVEFRDAQGKALASFIAGKKYFKREPQNPERAIGDGRFVLLPGDPGNAIIVSTPLSQATAKTSEWISHAGLAVDRLNTLEYRPFAGEGWKIERPAETAPWKLAGLKPQEKLEITKANSAAYALTMLEVSDVAPKEARPEDLGLDRADLVTASTFDGLSYTIKVGRLSGEQHAISVSVAGEPKVEGKDAEERSRKLAERLARERSLEGYVLLVARSRLEDVLKKRADLLARPEEKK